MAEFDFAKGWRELMEEVTTGMAEWRTQHPRATFTEIETALDERLNRARATMLADAAMSSQAADWRQAAASEQPVCPDCGARVHSRGEQSRGLESAGGQEVRLSRHYAVCPGCGKGFFPPG